MAQKYLLNLIQANLETIVTQLEDDITFMPDSEDAGTTEEFTEARRRLIMADLRSIQSRLRQTLQHIDMSTLKEDKYAGLY